MSIFSKFLQFLDNHGRAVVIPDRTSNEPYLTRYYVFLKNRKWFPINMFIHNFHKGDPDDLHDHPWCYFTVILKGGYWEHTPTGKIWRGRGSCRFASSRSLHRIELEPGLDTWTLFCPGPKLREWGFVDNGIWKHHEKYLAERYKN